MANLDRLQEIAACLPDSVLGELVDYAEFLKAKHDRLSERVIAWHASLPEDDEPSDRDEEAAAAAAIEEANRGEAISLEALRAKYDL